MILHLDPLDKAIVSLNRALARAVPDASDEELRDACIQRFEYTFELCWKMLKRRLEIDVANSTEVDSYSKRQLFRVGGERGYIQNVDVWFDYLEKRNLTVHTYDPEQARDVASVIPAFAVDAAELLKKLQARHD